MTKKAPIYIEILRDGTFIILGMFCAAFGLKGFLLPNHFIDGGVMGISILTSIITDMPLAYLVALINLPFIFVGYKVIGIKFSIKSTIAILALAACLGFLDFPEITKDKLLAAIFGGALVGAGIGLNIRGESVLDGTEIMAIITSKRTNISIGSVILVFNIFIFAIGAFVLGPAIAMYSILTYFAASKTVDLIVHGMEEYIGVLIVSGENEKIKAYILEELGRGVTILNGRGGLSNGKQDVLFCVVTRLQIPSLKRGVTELDENAFLVTHVIEDTLGGRIEKRPFH